jgi:predicted AAA+ superfamily ATPase
MFSRLLDRPLALGQSFFLFGPRGTGKTTWLRQRFPDALYLDLLDASLHTELLAHPDRLRGLVPPRNPDWIVIDEVQRVPEVLNEVHRLMVERGLRFVLTGSSARSLRRKGTNLLAGRALTFRMYPLTTIELGTAADLDRSLLTGRLPPAVSAPDPRAFLKSYVQTYLREEVQQERLVRNMSSFSRFLEAASFSQGALLNVAEVARECSVERKTIAGYFEILGDLLLAATLPVFNRRAKRRLAAHPKFYFFDAGVYRAVRPAGPLDRPEEIEGACLETLFYQELSALNEYLGLEYSLSYWRTAAGAEVDFVLYGQRGIIAIEVKRTRHLSSRDLAGLAQFKADYPQARCLLLAGVSRREYRDGIEIINLEDGLSTLPDLIAGPGPSRSARRSSPRAK